MTASPRTLASRLNGKLGGRPKGSKGGGRPPIQDQFSGEPDRRKRYQLRQAAKLRRST